MASTPIDATSSVLKVQAVQNVTVSYLQNDQIKYNI